MTDDLRVWKYKRVALKHRARGVSDAVLRDAMNLVVDDTHSCPEMLDLLISEMQVRSDFDLLESPADRPKPPAYRRRAAA